MDEEIVLDIIKHTGAGWYGLASPDGWDEIVADTHKKLLDLDPNYEVHQIKEKWGSLRYYCSIDHLEEAQSIIDEATKRSAKMCQECGWEENVALTVIGYTVATLCRDHFDLYNADYIKRAPKPRESIWGYSFNDDLWLT